MFRVALDPHTSLVSVHDFPHNRKSQSGAPCPPLASSSPIESLENTLAVGRRDDQPLVSHGHNHFAVAGVNLNGNG